MSVTSYTQPSSLGAIPRFEATGSPPPPAGFEATRSPPPNKGLKSKPMSFVDEMSFVAKRRPRAVSRSPDSDEVERSSYYPLDTEESNKEGEEEGHRGSIETDSDEESGSYHDDSDSDSDGDELNDDSSAFDGDEPYHESFGQDIVDGFADEDDTDDADEHHVPRDFDKSAERGMYLLAKTMKQIEEQGKSS